MNNAFAKVEFSVPTVTVMVSLEIASNMPGSGKFGGIIGPGQVAELDGMFALVSYHEWMNKAGVIIFRRGPKTTKTVLGLEDSDIKGSLGLIVEE